MTALTVREAIKSPSPAIGFFYQDSPMKAIALVTIFITDLVKFFNVGKTMNDFQIGQTVNLIFEDDTMRCLKPDDFKVCFTNMKKGFYGKTFDRIDGQIIFEILNQYLNERQLECEQISIDNHKQRLKNDAGEVNPEGQKKVLEILKAAVKESQPVKIEKEIKPVKKVFVKSERDNFIQNCFYEFTKIWTNNPYKPPLPKSIPGLIINTSSSAKHIEFNGKAIDEIEYVKLRLEEYDQLINSNKELKDIVK